MSAACFLSNSLNFSHNHPRNATPIQFSKPPRASGSNQNDKTKSPKRSECKDQEFSLPSSGSSRNSSIRAPTAPWMKGPLLLEPDQVLNLSKTKPKKDSAFGRAEFPDKELFGKVSGSRGRKAMKKIFEGIDKLQETQNSGETQKDPEGIKFRFSPGQLWGDGGHIDGSGPLAEEYPVLENHNSLENVELNILEGEADGGGDSGFRGRRPWERAEKMVFGRFKKDKVVTAAESNLDAVLLKRLRGEAARMRKWVKVKKAGITQDVVHQIQLIWRNNELAMLKLDVPLCRNMDRAREIVELKTGGLVVWRNKDSLVVYRGYCCHSLPENNLDTHHNSSGKQSSSSKINHQYAFSISEEIVEECSMYEYIREKDCEEENIAINGSLYERETDRLLDGLGPRYVDWWWPKPLPVDADLLPEVVPGFKTPFRLHPPFGKSRLTDDELTFLRKFARALPTHFVLGRNRKLQGLATSILKLWEKCIIAKIAVKWGIPNTDNEQMAYELKNLTGGDLLLRNKFFIVLYRGNDFVPSRVANLVAEREMELMKFQIEEEAARLKGTETFSVEDIETKKYCTVGTLSEFQNMKSEFLNLKCGDRDAEVQQEAEKERLEKELRTQKRKLFILNKKIETSSHELAKLNSAWESAEYNADQEMITEEERECLRKVGLKMDGSLVLGRRGIFDGVVEGLHQHWKHREVVKVITMQRRVSQVIHTAQFLEAESGGILVSIDKLKEGHAIIIYRGKNYKRPKLKAHNLLNKRDALSRSLEMQRSGSLKYFAREREQVISDLKCKLALLTGQGFDNQTDNKQEDLE